MRNCTPPRSPALPCNSLQFQPWRRHFIGIEREAAKPARTAPRIPFAALLENGLLQPGQSLYFNRQSGKTAVVLADGTLRTADGERGSIHKIGAVVGDLPACNGWEHWYYANEQGELVVIDTLREKIRQEQTHR